MKTLDVQGLLCPLPVLKAKKVLRDDVSAGGMLEVLATDPGSQPDFEVFCETAGYDLRESTEEDGVFRFLIRKPVAPRD